MHIRSIRRHIIIVNNPNTISWTDWRCHEYIYVNISSVLRLQYIYYIVYEKVKITKGMYKIIKKGELRIEFFHEPKFSRPY